jgi:hypothetical protein
MKINSLIIPAAFAGLLVLSGCNTAPYDKGDSASRSYRDGSWEVQGESRTLDAVMNSLNNLVNQSAADLKPQYARFDQTLYQLEDMTSRNDRAASRIQVRNSEYLESWNHEISTMSFEAIRERSEARKNDVSQHFDTVNRRYAEARSTVEPLIDYLNDIRRALSADLTQSGLQNVKPIVLNANANARKVQDALGRLSTELAATSASMSSVTYQAAMPHEARTAQVTVTPEQSIETK